jgi:putative ABC transport system permease protein
MRALDRFGRSVAFAVRGVGANRLRSVLTTLGILIGVAAVIILVAVGNGSSVAVKQQLTKLGSNTLTVRLAGGSFGGGGGGTGRAGGGGRVAALLGLARPASTNTGPSSTIPRLTVDDATALLDPAVAPDVAAIAPQASATGVTATNGGTTHALGSFTGTTPSYFPISDDTFSAGGPFTDTEYLAHAKVVVLGATAATDLFGGADAALDQRVALNGQPYTVVGVLSAKGSTGFVDVDDSAVAPLTTTQDYLSGPGNLASITVQATSARTIDAAQAEIEAVLDGRHHVTAATRDYSVQNQATLLAAVTSTNKTFTVLLGAVAAISLLVGGIGVMNIMLVTVTERTREIGIRKAIGARRSDILGQFLVEAVLLSVFGAVVGVAAGLVGSHFRIVGVRPVVQPYSVLLAFAVALLTGLFFGIYPANRAASLRPMEALRHE